MNTLKKSIFLAMVFVAPSLMAQYQLTPFSLTSENNMYGPFGLYTNFADQVLLVGQSSDYLDEDGNDSISSAGSIAVYRRGLNGEYTYRSKILTEPRLPGVTLGAGEIVFDGDYVLTAASYDDYDGNGGVMKPSSGSVYIFEKQSDDEYKQVQKLTLTDRDSGDQFGSAIAVEGDYLVVGCQAKDYSIYTNAGMAVVYKKSEDGRWVFHQELFDFTPHDDEYFGTDLAMHDDFLVVGCPGNSYNNQYGYGAIVFYKLNENGQWEHYQTIENEGNDDFELFGKKLTMNAHGLMIGMEDHWLSDTTIGGPNDYQTGIAQFYTLMNGNWELAQEITSVDFSKKDRFGCEVKLLDTLCFIGAEGESKNFESEENDFAGAVYKYALRNGKWEYRQKIISPNWGHDRSSLFGHSFSVTPEMLIIGEPFFREDDIYGLVHIYENEQIFEENSMLDQQKVSTLEIFPVPFDNEVCIRSKQLISDIFLHNLSGEHIFKKEGIRKYNTTLHLNCDEGVYLCTLKFEDGSEITKKIVK